MTEEEIYEKYEKFGFYTGLEFNLKDLSVAGAVIDDCESSALALFGIEGFVLTEDGGRMAQDDLVGNFCIRELGYPRHYAGDWNDYVRSTCAKGRRYIAEIERDSRYPKIIMNFMMGSEEWSKSH